MFVLGVDCVGIGVNIGIGVTVGFDVLLVSGVVDHSHKCCWCHLFYLNEKQRTHHGWNHGFHWKN